MSGLKSKKTRLSLVDFSGEFWAGFFLAVGGGAFFLPFCLMVVGFFCIKNSVSCQTRLLIDLFFYV